MNRQGGPHAVWITVAFPPWVHRAGLFGPTVDCSLLEARAAAPPGVALRLPEEESMGERA